MTTDTLFFALSVLILAIVLSEIFVTAAVLGVLALAARADLVNSDVSKSAGVVLSHTWALGVLFGFPALALYAALWLLS